jgi:hypothetical protein
MRWTLALVLALAACGSSNKKPVDPYAPRPDDIPQVLTCCVAVDAEGTPAYSTVQEDKCPEDNRNPLDACDIGPGDLPRPQ